MILTEFTGDRTSLSPMKGGGTPIKLINPHHFAKSWCLRATRFKNRIQKVSSRTKQVVTKKDSPDINDEQYPINKNDAPSQRYSNVPKRLFQSYYENRKTFDEGGRKPQRNSIDLTVLQDSEGKTKSTPTKSSISLSRYGGYLIRPPSYHTHEHIDETGSYSSSSSCNSQSDNSIEIGDSDKSVFNLDERYFVAEVQNLSTALDNTRKRAVPDCEVNDCNKEQETTEENRIFHCKATFLLRGMYEHDDSKELLDRPSLGTNFDKVQCDVTSTKNEHIYSNQGINKDDRMKDFRSFLKAKSLMSSSTDPSALASDSLPPPVLRAYSLVQSVSDLSLSSPASRHQNLSYLQLTHANRCDVQQKLCIEKVKLETISNMTSSNVHEGLHNFQEVSNPVICLSGTQSTETNISEMSGIQIDQGEKGVELISTDESSILDSGEGNKIATEQGFVQSVCPEIFIFREDDAFEASTIETKGTNAMEANQSSTDVNSKPADAPNDICSNYKVIEATAIPTTCNYRSATCSPSNFRILENLNDEQYFYLDSITSLFNASEKACLARLSSSSYSDVEMAFVTSHCIAFVLDDKIAQLECETKLKRLRHEAAMVTIKNLTPTTIENHDLIAYQNTNLDDFPISNKKLSCPPVDTLVQRCNELINLERSERTQQRGNKSYNSNYDVLASAIRNALGLLTLKSMIQRSKLNLSKEIWGFANESFDSLEDIPIKFKDDICNSLSTGSMTSNSSTNDSES